ncbi:hypothetical protein EVAR_29306_1 [Eumeta japonica]|uniref:Uncharacterized protein n=1 Tax=Eumeta variegata TaxID=151549 RepID=A0A4C1VVT0_EUMVA|nr:hypothetical protein EVAR_29306_1 [Eumeta japonica]
MQPRVSSRDQSEGIPRTRPRKVTLNNGMKTLKTFNARRGLQRNASAVVEFRKETAMQILPILFMLPSTMSLALADCRIFPKDTGWSTLPVEGEALILWQ